MIYISVFFIIRNLKVNISLNEIAVPKRTIEWFNVVDSIATIDFNHNKLIHNKTILNNFQRFIFLRINIKIYLVLREIFYLCYIIEFLSSIVRLDKSCIEIFSRSVRVSSQPEAEFNIERCKIGFGLIRIWNSHKIFLKKYPSEKNILRFYIHYFSQKKYLK